MQGYVTLATGSRFYLEQAINLSLSLKLNDPRRQVCIVIDKGSTLPPEFTHLVDKVAYLEPKEGYHGCLNKLRMLEVSPFEETMFIDSDCILVKDDMDRHWSKFQSSGFSITGSKKTTGKWYGFSIAKVIETLHIDYMAVMNSGVFYFRKGTESQLFFDTTMALVANHKSLLGTFHRNKLQLADEPFIGAAIGILKLDTVNYQPKDGTVMVTTINSSHMHFDPFKKISTLTRHDDFRLLDRFFPRKKVLHSPSLPHFVKLKPTAQYLRIANELRSYYKVPEFTL